MKKFISKESATLANRLIEGQVLNAQYAEDAYHLKHENFNLKKELEEIHLKNLENIKENTDQDSSISLILSNDTEELETLREAVHKLTLVFSII